MDLFRSKAPACEVIIRILTGNDKEFSTKLRHIVLPVTTHTTINHLKSKLHGVTKVPVDRILLLFCGRTVGPGHLRIPAEAFEYTTALDEDVIKFKPHLCMCILSERDKGEKEKGPNDSCDERNSTPAAKEGSYFEDHSDQKKLAHQQGAKRHRNPYGSFDIEQELAKIKLEKFAPVLISAGYGNEVTIKFELVQFRYMLSFKPQAASIMAFYHRALFPSYLRRHFAPRDCGSLLVQPSR